MASISLKKRATERLSKLCLSLNHMMKVLDEVQKKKIRAAEKLQKNLKLGKLQHQMLSPMRFV